MSTLKERKLKFETLQLHVGQEEADPVTDARAVPIYQTSSYVFHNSQHAADRFALKDAGNIYGRLTNPTEDVFEKRIASLEGGVAALAVGSGAAAVAYAIQNLAFAGDHVVAAKNIYGGTYNLLAHTFVSYGINTTFVDPFNYEEIEGAIKENTKLFFIETLGNPNSEVVDIEKIAKIAHKHQIPLVIDNTFATPYLFRPFEHGVDIVCYSATKYLAGHGVVIAGMAVEKGGFNWLNGRFPEFETFYEANKKDIGEDVLKEVMFTKRLRMRYLTDLGGHMSPQTAFYVLQGMETLSLRMDRHVKNAQKLAEFLEQHPAIKEVSYPGLKSSPYYELAQKYFPKGPGAMMAIRVKGGLKGALQVLEKVEVFDYMVNVGDAKSLIVHPASSTHFGHSVEEQAKAGVYEDTLRLSIGIEDVEDLIADLDQALEGITD